MDHDPLSRRLELLVADPTIRTLNDLVDRTEGRGLFLVIILLCLPFITPIPVPGYSNVVGFALLIVAYRLFLHRPTRLPRFLGSRAWQPQRLQRVLRASLRFVRWLERFIKPRRSLWLRHPSAVRAHAALLGFLAFLLALPLPPFMPFSNSLPAYGIIFLCAALMEEDGSAVWISYAVTMATLTYFVAFAGAIVRFIVLYEERILQFFRDLL